MLYIGVDIGFQGAIAILRDLDLISLSDMPVVKINGKNTYDVDAIASILRQFGGGRATIAIEKYGLRRGQGISSQAKPAYCQGLFEGMGAAFDMSPVIVTPQRWQKDYDYSGCDGRKEIKANSRGIAAALFKIPELFSRVKDDGRADAALIALWLARGAGGNK